MDDTLIIEPRFNGPRLSGNGGYVGGVMAGKFARAFGDGAVEITLRAPIPIDRRMQGAPRICSDGLDQGMPHPAGHAGDGNPHRHGCTPVGGGTGVPRGTVAGAD